MRPCPTCKGSGKGWGISSDPCEICLGDGQLPDPEPGQLPCNFCYGSGHKQGKYREFCPHCGGTGYRFPKQQPQPEPEGPLVFFIEAGKPRTGHLQLSAIFAELKGTLRVCDPYYGTGSLLRLDSLAHRSVQLLTQNPDAKEQKAGVLSRAIAEFVKEHPMVEFRCHQGKDLHDRYILTDDELILLGHGLEDVGNKDSFVARLKNDLAAGVVEDVRRSFDDKWAKATPIV